MVFRQPTIKVFVTVSIIALQLLRESYFLFPDSTTIEVMGQSSKTCSPILVTLLGMVIEVRPLQPEKAYLPIVVTLFGMVMEVRSLQSKYLYISVYQSLLGKTVEK